MYDSDYEISAADMTPPMASVRKQTYINETTLQNIHTIHSVADDFMCFQFPDVCDETCDEVEQS
jgi:hypothetical protein